MFGKRGQASTEALVIIGLAVVLVFILLYAVIPVIMDFATFSESVQAERSMSKIVGAIEAASAYGPGTETTLYVYLPAGKIEYVSANPPVFVFTLKDQQTAIVRPLDVNINLAPASFDAAGIKTITIKKEEIDKVSVNIS